MIPPFVFAALLWIAPPRHVTHHPATHRAATHRSAAHRAPARRAPRRRRYVGISPERVRQIQQALVDAGYLQTVDGEWGPETRDAMKKYQQAHHWQTIYVPDARALIALGLGPTQDEPPQATATTRPTPAPGGAAPAPANATQPGSAAPPSTSADDHLPPASSLLANSQ